jgi:hypothetical protein
MRDADTVATDSLMPAVDRNRIGGAEIAVQRRLRDGGLGGDSTEAPALGFEQPCVLDP